MSLDRQAQGWGDPGSPGSVQERTFRQENIVKVKVAGITVYLHRSVSYLFKSFIKELTSTGYSVSRSKDDWGYANRTIIIGGRDTGKKSNHAWGLACDLNATTNPVTYDGRVHGDLPQNVAEIARKYGLFWGGNYSATGYRDPMHFEFLGTPREAVKLTASLRRAAKKNATPTSEPKSSVEGGKFITVRQGDSWEALSAVFYGDTEHAYAIKKANLDRLLEPGHKVYIPARNVFAPWKIVVVRQGDTWRTLSRRYYGTSNRVKRIKVANPDAILVKGARIRIPVG